MKMIATTSAALPTDFAQYVHNCLRNVRCEPAYFAPLPAVSSLQLYADFGEEQPLSFEIYLVDVCGNVGATEQITPTNYVVGQTPEAGWYGVFKNFSLPPSTPAGFVAYLSVEVASGTKTYFSQAFTTEGCEQLTKIKSCHPEGATTTGFDLNGIYYGLPVGNSYMGTGSIRYFHIAWVRRAKLQDSGHKATFTASFTKNFRSVIEKTSLLKFEFVPKWYKDVLLAIFSRGAISVNDGDTLLVNELAFEGLNEDDLTWKAWVQLKQTYRLYYGCDDSRCSECCTPSGIVVNQFGGVGPEPHGIIDNDGTLLTDNDGTLIIYP